MARAERLGRHATVTKRPAQGNAPAVAQDFGEQAPRTLPLSPETNGAPPTPEADPANAAAQVLGTPEKHLKDQLDFADDLHRYVQEYIRQADQKAAFFFAGSTALLTYLHSATLIKLWWKAPATWILVDVLSFAATVSLVAAAGLSL